MLAALLFACAAHSAHADEPNATKGEQVYKTWCLPCHGAGIGNPGMELKPGTAALQAKYEGRVPALLTERTDLTPDFVALFVRQGVSIMPFFRKTEISDQDLADLGAYLARKRD